MELITILRLLKRTLRTLRRLLATSLRSLRNKKRRKFPLKPRFNSNLTQSARDLVMDAPMS